MQKHKVGFIGLGLMGIPMSRNILKAGFPLVVYNRTVEKTKELEKLGASVARSSEDLAQQTDVIVTMVTAGSDVEEVLFGKQGVVNGAKKDLVVIDMSTIGPTAAKAIAEKLAKSSIGFIDAPVTGSTPKAKSGELTIFIGGKKESYEKVKDVLSAMGTNLQYIGDVGSGQAIKLINNHIVATTLVSLIEAMLLADAEGLDRKKVAEVLQTIPAMSEYMKLKLPNIAKRDYPLLFSIANMKKDLSLALTEAKKSQKKFPTLSITEHLFTNGTKQGFADKDIAAIAQLLEEETSE